MKRLLSLYLLCCILFGLFPSSVSAGSMDGWSVSTSGTLDTELTIDTSIFRSGSASLKITRSTPTKSNVYTSIEQRVPVEKGKTYRYGTWVKAENATSTSLAFLINWERRAYLAPVKSTFDWIWYDFSYTHLGSTGNVTLKFIVNSPCKAYWIDDVEFVETKDGIPVGGNLLKNPGFEGTGSSQPQIMESITERFNSRIDKAEFSVQDFNDNLAASKVIPVYKTDGIIIDGDLTEWADYAPVKLPMLPNQKTEWLLQEADAKVDMRFAYDDKYLYFSSYVTDDVYYPIEGSEYWRGDSIQLCLGDMEGSYGAEIGFSYNDETGVQKYSLEYGESQMLDLLVDVSVREGENGKKIIVYEAAIPWELRWGELQDEVLFTALYNENDGSGRISAIQLSPGISEGKSNAQFPTLKMIPQGNEFFAWSDTLVRTFIETDTSYNIYVMNNSNQEKEYTIRIDEQSYETKLTVPEKSVRRLSETTRFSRPGAQNVSVIVSDNNQVQSVNCKFDVKSDSDYYNNVLDEIKKRANEISSLMKKCRDKGISTDYEEPAEFLLVRFHEYIKDDLAAGVTDRLDYTIDALERIYAAAKEDLEGYLSGTKTPKTLPRYRTSEMDIDGLTLTADAEMDGVTERRPVFYVGYGHFREAQSDIPNFSALGANIIQSEIGPSSFVNEPRIPFFSITGNYNMRWELVDDKSGEWPNKYLKVVCLDPQKPNVFKRLVQSVGVEPNTTYEYGFRIKTTNAGALWTSLEEWPLVRNFISGTSDWKEVSFEHTTGPSHKLAHHKQTMFNITFEHPADEILIDNIWVRKKGTDENLIYNGDFEARYMINNDIMIADTSKRITDILESADENNIAVNFLISPHYFPFSLLPAVENELPGNMKWLNPKSVRSKEVVAEYLKVLLPKIGRHKSLNSICIANEPTFLSLNDTARDYWKKDFEEFLSDIYGGDITVLNNVYGTEHTSFADVQMPKDMETTTLFYDWKMFNDKLTNEWMAWVVDIIKQYLPHIPVHAKIMQTTYANDSALRLHMKYGSNPELYAKISDLNGNDAYNYYSSSSKTVFEKSMWYDLQVSMKLMPVVNSEDHIFRDGSIVYNPDIAIHGGADIWQGALHGRGQSVIWVWAHNYNQQSITNSVLTRPDAIYEISKASLDLNRLAHEVTALQTREGQVGLIFSDASRVYQTAYINNLYNAYTATLFNGQTPGLLPDTQILNIHRYPVVVVPYVTNTFAEVLDEMIRYIDGGGTLVLLGEDCLLNDERNLPHDIAKVEYIKSKATIIPTANDRFVLTSPNEEQLQELMAEILDKKNMRRVRIVDADTGKDAHNIEYRYTDYNGSLLINLCNYKWGNDATLKVLVDGKEISSCTELRNGDALGSSFKAKPYVPMLIKIDGDYQVLDKGIRLQIGNPVMTVNGLRSLIDSKQYDVFPIISNGRTLLPARRIVEALGGQIDWDEKTQTVTITKNSDVIKLKLGDKEAYVNGQMLVQDTEPISINGRIMLPVRFIAEHLGLKVEWHEEKQMIVLN
jgi:hypothetical protein